MNTEQEQELMIRLFGQASVTLALLWDIFLTIEKITGVSIETSDISYIAGEIQNPAGAATGFITIEMVEEILSKKRKTTVRRLRAKHFTPEEIKERGL